MAGLPSALTLARRRLTAYLFLVAVVVFGFWVDHQQDIDRCRARNDSTEESVGILRDALVAAATDSEPQRVEAFRDDIDRRLADARVDCT